MARGSAAAQQGAQAGIGQNQQLFGNASGLYGTVAPQLEAEAANPQGFDPATRARMKTEAEQTAGGTNAGVTGEAGLIEGRTRNAGSTGMALTNAARNAGKTLTNADLATNLEDAQLKERQRQAGLAGEQGLYGTTLGGSEGALGQVANNANANTNAVNASWDWARDLFAPIVNAAGGAAAKIV